MIDPGLAPSGRVPALVPLVVWLSCVADRGWCPAWSPVMGGPGGACPWLLQLGPPVR